jgi:dolichol-phosphate mannosyltransferase
LEGAGGGQMFIWSSAFYGLHPPAKHGCIEIPEFYIMVLSVVIPAYNEAGNLPATIRTYHAFLCREGISHEILVVNDDSSDDTLDILNSLQTGIPSLGYVTNPSPHNGFGFAVRKGLDCFKGDCVAIVMADGSDDPADLIRFYRLMVSERLDCVFGSRFMKQSVVKNYPWLKLRINRVANNLVRIVFGIRYNDCTNAFKLYQRHTIEGLKPFLSPHFNLTLELPLKAIVRGYSYKVLPNNWRNRKHGTSNLRIREMGSRYFFILLYCLIEKFFSKGDFQKKW